MQRYEVASSHDLLEQHLASLSLEAPEQFQQQCDQLLLALYTKDFSDQPISLPNKLTAIINRFCELEEARAADSERFLQLIEALVDCLEKEQVLSSGVGTTSLVRYYFGRLTTFFGGIGGTPRVDVRDPLQDYFDKLATFILFEMSALALNDLPETPAKAKLSHRLQRIRKQFQTFFSENPEITQDFSDRLYALINAFFDHAEDTWIRKIISTVRANNPTLSEWYAHCGWQRKILQDCFLHPTPEQQAESDREKIATIQIDDEKINLACRYLENILNIQELLFSPITLYLSSPLVFSAIGFILFRAFKDSHPEKGRCTKLFDQWLNRLTNPHPKQAERFLSILFDLCHFSDCCDVYSPKLESKIMAWLLSGQHAVKSFKEENLILFEACNVIMLRASKNAGRGFKMALAICLFSLYADPAMRQKYYDEILKLVDCENKDMSIIDAEWHFLSPTFMHQHLACYHDIRVIHIRFLSFFMSYFAHVLFFDAQYLKSFLNLPDLCAKESNQTLNTLGDRIASRELSVIQAIQSFDQVQSLLVAGVNESYEALRRIFLLDLLDAGQKVFYCKQAFFMAKHLENDSLPRLLEIIFSGYELGWMINQRFNLGSEGENHEATAFLQRMIVHVHKDDFFNRIASLPKEHGSKKKKSFPIDLFDPSCFNFHRLASGLLMSLIIFSRADFASKRLGIKSKELWCDWLWQVVCSIFEEKNPERVSMLLDLMKNSGFVDLFSYKNKAKWMQDIHLANRWLSSSKTPAVVVPKPQKKIKLEQRVPVYRHPTPPVVIPEETSSEDTDSVQDMPLEEMQAVSPLSAPERQFVQIANRFLSKTQYIQSKIVGTHEPAEWVSLLHHVRALVLDCDVKDSGRVHEPVNRKIDNLIEYWNESLAIFNWHVACLIKKTMQDPSFANDPSAQLVIARWKALLIACSQCYFKPMNHDESLGHISEFIDQLKDYFAEQNIKLRAAIKGSFFVAPELANDYDFILIPERPLQMSNVNKVLENFWKKYRHYESVGFIQVREQFFEKQCDLTIKSKRYHIDLSFSLMPLSPEAEHDLLHHYFISSCAVHYYLNGQASIAPKAARSIYSKTHICLELLDQIEKEELLSGIGLIIKQCIKYQEVPARFTFGRSLRQLLQNLSYCEDDADFNQLAVSALCYLFDRFTSRKRLTMQWILQRDLLKRIAPMSYEQYARCKHYFQEHFQWVLRDDSALEQISPALFIALFFAGEVTSILHDATHFQQANKMLRDVKNFKEDVEDEEYWLKDHESKESHQKIARFWRPRGERSGLAKTARLFGQKFSHPHHAATVASASASLS